MTEAIFFMSVLGAACGSALGIASIIFYVYEDPRIEEVERHLAGANCGACGYIGCHDAAVAVVEGKALPNVCVVGGLTSAAGVAAIIGADVGVIEPLLAINECQGGRRAADKYYYTGVKSCRALAALFGGQRVCQFGCLGFGDCVKACLFNAISMGPEGFPLVNEQKCIGCGACERACPKNIIKVSGMSERLLHFNQENDRLAPCRQACPAEIDIPRYITQIKNKDNEAALQTIRERNPLPLSCGRVCPHPCESNCRRGIEDEPVAINLLKRFVADLEMNSGRHLPIPCAAPTGKRVAVVGSGPAGLSCAYFLRRLGHDVTLFEAMPKLGGMLRYGIPEYRLPKKVLDWDIASILNLGVRYHTNLKLGSDVSLQYLADKGYEAVFLGVGAWKDYMLGVKGEHLNGCYTGIDFLSKIGQGETVPVGRRAAVIGGGKYGHRLRAHTETL